MLTGPLLKLPAGTAPLLGGRRQAPSADHLGAENVAPVARYDHGVEPIASEDGPQGQRQLGLSAQKTARVPQGWEFPAR